MKRTRKGSTLSITAMCLVLGFTVLVSSILLALLLSLALPLFVSWLMLVRFLIYLVDLRREAYVLKATTRQSHQESSET